MEDQNGKDALVHAEQTTVARKRSKPSLVKLGNRYLTSDGYYHKDLCADYLLANGRDKWIGVAQLSKVMCGSPTIDGKRKVRKNMFAVFAHLLLHHSEFLVYELSGPQRRIHAVKLLDVKAEADKQAAKLQVERMRKALHRVGIRFETACRIIDNKEALAGVS